MGSIVLDLQQEVISQDCDIVNALRKAHLIAVKLGLEEFDKWICNELNGYQSKDLCPNYRKIHSTLMALNPHCGWVQAVITSPELENEICEHSVKQSVSEIIALVNSNGDTLGISCSGTEIDYFNKIFDNPLPTQFVYHISKASVTDIIEKVKNTLLEWTLQLEKEGIMGENMAFNEKEKEQAKSIPQTINNYYGNTNVVNGTANNSPMVAGNNNTVSISKEELGNELSKIADEIKNTNEISTDDIETALELLSDIRDKIDCDKKSSIIKSGLVGLRDFLITAGGGFVANMLASLITRL